MARPRAHGPRPSSAETKTRQKKGRACSAYALVLFPLSEDDHLAPFCLCSSRCEFRGQYGHSSRSGHGSVCPAGHGSIHPLPRKKDQASAVSDPVPSGRRAYGMGSCRSARSVAQSVVVVVVERVRRRTARSNRYSCAGRRLQVLRRAV
jgi:hypothetical protein